MKVNNYTVFAVIVFIKQNVMVRLGCFIVWLFIVQLNFFETIDNATQRSVIKH